MRRCTLAERAIIDFLTRSLLVVLAVSLGLGADDPHRIDGDLDHTRHELHLESSFAEQASTSAEDVLALAIDQARWIGGWLTAWYRRTPPGDRVTWGAMTACAGLGLGVLLERLVRLRRHKIVPVEFTARFLDRLHNHCNRFQ